MRKIQSNSYSNLEKKSGTNKIAHPIRICQHILQTYFRGFEKALTEGDKETAERLLDHMKKELARVPTNNDLKTEFDENLPKG